MSGINKLTPTALQGNLPSAKLGTGELVLQQANITRVPQSMIPLSKAVTLRGESQGQNPDGTTRIQTPRGTIDVRLDPPLPKGQRADIQIPSGNPPREAIVQTTAPRPGTQIQTPTQPQPQPAPQAPAQQGGSPAPTPAPDPAMDGVKSLQQAAQQATQKIAAAVKQSVDPGQIMPNASAPQSAPTPRALQPGQIIRLTPLPPALQNPAGLSSLPQTPIPAQSTALTPLPQLPALPAGPQQTLPMPAITSLSSLMQGITLTAGIKAENTVSAMLKTLISPHLLPSTANPFAFSANALPQTASSLPVRAMPDAQVMSVLQPVLIPAAGLVTPSSPLTVAQILPPSSPLLTLQAGQIMATATGHMTPGGNPVIQMTVAGQPQPVFFALNYPAAALPKGTQIIMQPGPPAVAPTAAQLPSAPFSWPVMEEVFELLLNQLTAAQAQSLPAIFPRPAPGGQQFTAAALLFIAAARGGDIAGWMGGRAEQILRNIQAGGKRDIIDRLMRDIGTAANRLAATDPGAPSAAQGSPEWRGYTLPLLFGMDISKMHVWAKPFGDDESGESDPDKAKGTRFIVDLSLSRMGSVQLDGLVQPYAKRLDLALKTEHEFTPPVRQHLRQLWHNALTQIEMSGQLDFMKV